MITYEQNITTCEAMIVSEGVTIPKNAEAFVAGQPSHHRGSREDEWPNFSGW
jgi:hypothetical protein